MKKTRAAVVFPETEIMKFDQITFPAVEVVDIQAVLGSQRTHRNTHSNLCPTAKGQKMSAEDQIRETVTSNDVVLFMKGTSTMPQCGFSSQIAGILNYMGVEYKDVNVLADDAVRQSIKEYSDWPTIPQLYVKGEFIGGCDIIRDMTLSGEFDGMLAENNINYDKAAAEEIRKANSA
jgi:monothiol glutaredoxin